MQISDGSSANIYYLAGGKHIMFKAKSSWRQLASIMVIVLLLTVCSVAIASEDKVEHGGMEWVKHDTELIGTPRSIIWDGH